MAFSFVFKTSLSDDGVSVAIPTLTVSADAKVEASVSAPHSATTEIDVTFPAALKAFLVKSDKAVTIKTNSSGAPDDTIALAAGGAVLFGTDGTTTLGANPIGTDVTKLYVVNAGGTTAFDATVEVRAGYDATP